jgi:hypothetical protein
VVEWSRSFSTPRFMVRDSLSFIGFRSLDTGAMN